MPDLNRLITWPFFIIMILSCRVSVRHVAGERFSFTSFILLISLLVFRLLQKPILCAYYNLVHYFLSNCILSSAFQCLLDIPLFSTQLPFFPNLSDSAPARHPSSLRGLPVSTLDLLNARYSVRNRVEAASRFARWHAVEVTNVVRWANNQLPCGRAIKIRALPKKNRRHLSRTMIRKVSVSENNRNRSELSMFVAMLYRNAGYPVLVQCTFESRPNTLACIIASRGIAMFSLIEAE